MRKTPLIELDYRPELPPKHDYGIGCVGAGAIMNLAHLPAYQKAGLRVLAITDINRRAAEETAQKFGIPRVCQSLEELLDTPGIDIVDVAVPAAANPEIAAKIFAAGKHALLQKPMAEDLEGGRKIVAMAKQARRKLAVNHQMRWCPSVRAALKIMKEGWLGEVVDFSIQENILTNWDAWPWLQKLPFAELTYHTIHLLDTTRAWHGDPGRVYATLAGFPQSQCVGPTRSYILMNYGGNLRGSILVNHHHVGPPDDYFARVTIDGTEGRLEGRLGLLLNYPVGLSDVIQFSSRALLPNGTIKIELEGRWIPDAFLGPMGSLMKAIEEDGEAETNGEEILGTLRLVEAVKRSHQSGQAVNPAEVGWP